MERLRGAMRAFGIALILSAALGAALFALSCSKASGSTAAAIRVVAITPSEASAPSEFRGAEDFVRDYASDKGKRA
jgi:hypothetical protein